MQELGVARFIEFRNKLRASFPKRSDALLELTDALSGNVTAKSPVELSLSPLFSRSYSSFHDAIDNFFRLYMDSRVLSDEKINERMQQPFSPYLEVVGELEKS